MTNSMPTFAVFSHRRFLGYVNAVSLKQAIARASKRFAANAESMEVELCQNVAPRAADRLLSNVKEAGKRNRRYASPDFEARRAALIAAHKAGL